MKNTKAKIFTVLIPILLLVLYIIKDSFFSLLYLLPPCFLYSHFHLYCPGCGNTRSVAALLRGDLLTALKYNIVPFLVLIIAIAGYIELATYSFGKPIKILPRKLIVYLILIALVFLYLIVRNFIPALAP